MNSWARRTRQEFDAVRVKYISLGSMKSVIFIKLESKRCQRRTQIKYKIDSGLMIIECHSKFSKLFFPQVNNRCVVHHKI